MEGLYGDHQVKMRSLGQILIHYNVSYKNGIFGHRDMYGGRITYEYEDSHLQAKESPTFIVFRKN